MALSSNPVSGISWGGADSNKLQCPQGPPRHHPAAGSVLMWPSNHTVQPATLAFQEKLVICILGSNLLIKKILTHHFKGQHRTNKTHLCAGSTWLLILPEATLPHFPLVKCKHLSAWRERLKKRVSAPLRRERQMVFWRKQKQQRERNTVFETESCWNLRSSSLLLILGTSSLPYRVGFPRK